MHQKIYSFLGFGNIAKSIVKGALQAGGIQASQILASSPSLQKGASCSYAVAKNNKEAARKGNVLYLTAKPDQIEEICKEIASEVDETKLIISIAAGKTTATIAQYLNNPRIPIIRAMTNTPVSVKCGLTGIYKNEWVTSEQCALAISIFESIGTVEQVLEEKDIDLITAVSGSGPAYFMYLAELMVDAAIARGLSPEMAQRVVKQTLYGTGILMNENDETFSQKRAQVTSKRGTTAAGINCLEKAHFSKLVDSMIGAAHHRAREISGVEQSDNCQARFFN